MAYTFEILRPDDLLALQVEARNLKLDTPRRGRPRLVRENRNAPAYLVFRFPPQSITEKAYFETAPVSPPPSDPAPNPPLPSNSDPLDPPGSTPQRMSGESRLVFRLPKGLNEIPYRIDALLDWSVFELVLPAAAAVTPGAAAVNPLPIARPGPLETAIEIPYRLIVSPSAMRKEARPAWIHERRPVTHAGRTELWHTRLARSRNVRTNSSATVRQVSEASESNRLPVRVVWSPDYMGGAPLPDHSQDTVPFRAAMSARDRDQIVMLNAGFSGFFVTDQSGGRNPFVPQPISASRLFLTALGGWLTSRGSWPSPVSYELPLPILALPRTPAVRPVRLAPPVETLDLVEWSHIATQGRDQYVRIVYEGYLYPFGHRASLIKVTERKFLSPSIQTSTSPVAYLRQRMYIVVREPEKTYVGAPYAHGAREMPLAPLVRIGDRVTPELDPPGYFGDSFWIKAGGQNFQFHLSARDVSGAYVNFRAPMIFVGLSETDLGGVQSRYLADDDSRRCVVRGQNVAYADPAAGDTVFKTTALYFDAQLSQAPPPYAAAPFIPKLDRASVTVPAIAQLLGVSTAVMIGLYDAYLQVGLDPNAGVFAQILGTPPGVKFSADKAGGFATPNLSLTALSARKGLISGSPLNASEGSINPKEFFGDIDAKLFGTIDLGDLIPLQGLVADAAKNAPEIRTQAIPNRHHPKKLITKIAWEPQLQNRASITFNDGGTSALKLHVRIERNLDGSPPISKATGELTAFRLDLLGVIGIRITSIKFNSTNGEKSTVAAHLAADHPIGFEGPLQFVQTLADILPPGLFGGKGPSIKLTPAAIKISFTIGLPPITCGAFSLQNIAITTGLDLPYLDGKPAFEFAFASRGRPFLVTVEIFGGGGFVHVVLDADGVQMVEGAIEFGGNFALDLGVATGAVHAMAGIYFQLKSQFTDLTGFVDIGGEVSVLGIISISIDLNLSLSWQSSPQGNLIIGRATLTISVHIIFFSISVGLSVERSFSAGGSDPKVYQLVNEAQWSQYAAAFA
jgi:hypothetical protein